MSESKTNKSGILKLIIKINIWMCIISVLAIFVVPLIITRLNIDSYERAIYVLGSAFLMPCILFGMTWIICIIYKFKKNIAKEIKEAYMLMPIYYIFFTLPFCTLVLHIINRFIQ